MRLSSNYMKKHGFWQGIALAACVLCLNYQDVRAQTPIPHNPEMATPVQAGQSATGSRIMVVTAHPEATRAGLYVLKNGGTAVDAAVAVQTVLGLVEPQSSGIGGGGFAVYYEAATKQVYSFDGRETAPMQAGRFLFTDDKGKPMEFYDAAVGGRSVGVPGIVRLLEMMHKRFGHVKWADLFNPAITLAQNGFKVTPRLAAMVDSDYDHLAGTTVATKLYFYPDATSPIAEGSILKNPAYANTLRKIATQGSDGFYKGDIAQDIAKTVQEYDKNPGLISMEDLANYKAIERRTICGTYHAYMLCTVGEPSGGGITLLETLGILENFNLAALGPKNPQSWHLIAEASRLAFVDRNYYLGDPHYVQSPGAMLADKAYTKTRAGLIDPNHAAKEVKEGVPAGWQKLLQRQKKEPVYPKPPGTTHFTIVDAAGNILSMTSSVEDAFGSRLYVDGFMLNNQLTDFSFTPEVDGKPVANRVEGGKRPRSSMAPVIMFSPDGKPFLIIGSAGGSAIPGYILERIISIIDWHMGLKDALAEPNILHRGIELEIENTADESLQPALENYGHPTRVEDLNSGLTAIEFNNGVMTGAADPRREGTAAGE